jgi:HSP20 family molecular chaperone IbpA
VNSSNSIRSLIGLCSQWSVARQVTVPSADVTETNNAYLVEVELPGVRREDVDVDLDGNELVVTGELKERKREGLFRRRTRRVGNFEYRVRLPGDLQGDKAEASLAYGVLTVYLPKAEGVQQDQGDRVGRRLALTPVTQGFGPGVS